IPLGEDLNDPIPLDPVGAGGTGVSHSPLELGGSNPVEKPKIEVPKPVEKKPAEKIVSADRIVGVKTFFTKLHPGAMNFLDEQITKWLHENPGISIKRTNIVTGMVQAKKTEPNIVITVWY
ncbi:MAG: hypothetical protein PVH77_02590, partial [Phycisphaerales bacterium]